MCLFSINVEYRNVFMLRKEGKEKDEENVNKFDDSQPTDNLSMYADVVQFVYHFLSFQIILDPWKRMNTFKIVSCKFQ